jgi:hypothetical protein
MLLFSVCFQGPVFTYGSTDGLFQGRRPSFGDHVYSNPAVSVESLNNFPAVLPVNSAVPETDEHDGNDTNKNIRTRPRLEKFSSITSENDVQLDFHRPNAGYTPHYKKQGPGIAHISGTTTGGKNTPLDAKWVQEGQTGDGTDNEEMTTCYFCRTHKHRCLFIFIVLVVLAVIAAAVLAIYFTRKYILLFSVIGYIH